MKDPWYAEGLRFECTACGGCCGGFPGFVWVSEPEAERMGAALGLSGREFLDRHCRRVGGRFTLRETGNWNCVMLERGRCRVYDARPVQCRTFPFWDENLEAPEDWAHAARSCPGMNAGRTFGLAEIERLRCERHDD